MNILALDPGSQNTAWVLYDGGEPLEWKTQPNDEVRAMLSGIAQMSQSHPDMLAVEYMRPRGMPTSQDEMDTMFELGRMVQAWGRNWKPISRHEVKVHICGQGNASDANIRAALIDRYGGSKAIAPAGKCLTCKGRGLTGRGKTREPCGTCVGTGTGAPAGLLHGLTGDAWSALAIAITAAEIMTK